MKTWKWFEPIYGMYIELMHGGPYDGFATFIERVAKCDQHTKEDLEQGRRLRGCVSFYCDSKGDAHLAFWFHDEDLRTINSLGVVLHETVHAALAMFRSREIPVTEETEEPLAFYQMYLFNEICARLSPPRKSTGNKRGKKKKG